MAGSKRGRVFKGDRVITTLRMPTNLHAHLMGEARMINVPMADYAMCRILLCEGMSIPHEYYLAHPGLLRMHDPAEWGEVLETLPAEVVAKIRKKFAEQLLEDVDETEDQAAARDLLRAEMETSGVFPDVCGQEVLALTG